MFKVPNQYRIKEGPLASTDDFGLCGAFEIPWTKSEGCYLYVIATEGCGTLGPSWEHVSVHGRTTRGVFTPSWDQMCFIKTLFWDADDCVIQFHPPKSEYVNRHKNTLHLWRKSGINWETPPKILIG